MMVRACVVLAELNDSKRRAAKPLGAVPIPHHLLNRSVSYKVSLCEPPQAILL